MTLKNRNIYNFTNFNPINKFLKKFNLKSFNNKKKINLYVKFFELEKLIKKLNYDNVKDTSPRYLLNLKKKNKKPLVFEFDDLCRLHWIVLTRKALNIMEFGSGFSTVFIADACSILSYYFRKVKDIRVSKKFHVYSLEENSKFLKITQKRLFKNLKKHVSLIKCNHKIIEYQGKFASRCTNIPNISPDLIYLDGPSQYFTKKKLNGFNFDSISRFPMSSDLLSLEYFLEPGTFIVVDGRTSNARFLKDFFKRKWKYTNDSFADTHYFELVEKPIGKYNLNKLNFCLDKKIKINNKF